MGISAGAAGTIIGATQLALSYSGRTTATADEEMTRAATFMLQSTSSPGSALGSAMGAAIGGDLESASTGAMVGGLMEGGASLTKGLLTRYRPGPGKFPEPLSEVSEEVWLAFNAEQRSAYELGQLTLRDETHELLKTLSPLERGRDLRALGTLGQLRAVDPRNLPKTWGTGLTPGGRLVGPYLIHGALQPPRVIASEPN
jgi:hypothetical protein